MPYITRTSHLHHVYGSTLKNVAGGLPVFASYYALLCISLIYSKFTRFLFIFCFSLTQGNARNVRLYYPYWR